jgi:uncharacterized protein (TIGR03089 family)
MMPTVDPVSALSARVGDDPASPLLTHVDAVAGTRIELSAVTFANNVAKTANLLRDEVLVDPGDVIAIDLPAHWQSGVWAVAAWSVGATLRHGRQPARVAITHDPTGHFDAEDVFVTALHPLGAPWSGPLPAGMQDWSTASRGHGDTFSLDRSVLSVDHSIEDIDPGISAGQRHLLATDDTRRFIATLAGVLVRSAALVLVTGAVNDVDALTRTADEGIDIVLD